MEGVSSRSYSSFISSSLLLILLLLVYLSSDGVMGDSSYKKIAKKVSTLQLERIQSYLEKINKTPVRSIKSPDGDIIDCVPIDKQPAFDHPLLKNHKIQRVPSSLPRYENERSPEKNYTAADTGASWQVWHQAGRCPKGTVAIRRIKVDDVLRAKSLYHFGKKQVKVPAPSTTAKSVVAPADDESSPRHEYATVRSTGKLHGAKAAINLWQPYVETMYGMSLAQIWIYAGTYGVDLNTVEAGWQVSPSRYGDGNSRLFIYWTRDYYNRTGCQDLLCPGFVQTSYNIAIGGTITPISSFGGTQHEITLHIWKDAKTGNWWLKYGESEVLGYWPAEIFTHLKEYATYADWGGEIVNVEINGTHTATDMGSGHYAEEGFRKAAFFHNLGIVDSTDTLRPPPPSADAYVSNAGCYDIKKDNVGNSWGTYFYYGGPGKNPNCP